MTTTAPAAAKPPRVPYLGQIKPGGTGEWVRLVKRALHNAGLYNGKTTGRGAGWAGPFFVIALAKLARAKRLPNHDGNGKVVHGTHAVKTYAVTGVYGPKAHVKLAAYFDEYGAAQATAILTARQRAARVAAIIASGVNAMRLIVAQRAFIRYSQTYRASGIRYKRLPPHYGGEEDCSSERAWVCWVMHMTAQRWGWSVPNPTYAAGTYNIVGNTTSERENPNVGWVQSFAAGVPGLTATHYLDPDHVGSKFTPTTIEEMGSDPGPLQVPPGYRRIYEIRTTYILDEHGKRAA